MAFNVGDLIARFKLDTSETTKAVDQVKRNLQKTFSQEMRDSIRNLAKTQEQVRYESAVAAREAAKHAAQAIKQANAFDKAKARATLASKEYAKATRQYEKYLKLTKEAPTNEKYAKQLEVARKQVEKRLVLEQRSAKMLDNIKLGAVQMSDGLKRASENAKTMFDHLKSVERIVGGILISQAFYTIAREIGNALTELTRFTGEMEKASIVFTHLMDSSDESKAFIYSMQDFAAETSFATDQALNLSKQLRAVGVPMEQIRSYMTTLNDAAQGAGASSEVVDRIVYALAQIKTTGRLLGTEMRQLANANIPIYKILHEQLGIAEKDLTRVGDLAVNGDVAVAAILQGLKQEFEGLAAEVSNSVPGLIDNIKDNLLMLGSTALQGPWEALGGRLRTIRETLDTYREIMANKGFGGLVEQLIGKGNTDVLRTLTASIVSLMKSMLTLTAAAAEVGKTIGGALLQTFALILPPIAQVVRALANLVHYVITTIAPVKLLVSAIAGLAISFAVGKSLLFLWRIAGIGIICSTVAKAVLILRNAILLLYAAIAKNPIIAAILLVAAALLSWIVSLKGVSDWIGRVTAQLANLVGIDTTKTLKVEDIGIADLAEKYNEAFDSVQDVNDKLAENGEEAEKTGKKIKKFLAAFDEVFQMPEDDGNDEPPFKIPDAVDFKIPEASLPDLVVPDLSDLAKKWEWPEWPEWPPLPLLPPIPPPVIPAPEPIRVRVILPEIPPIRIPIPEIPPIRIPVVVPVIPPIHVPVVVPPISIPLPTLAPVREWVRGFGTILGELPSWVAVPFGVLQGVFGQIPNWLSDSLKRVGGLLGDFPGTILVPTANAFGQFATDVLEYLQPVGNSILETVGQWGINFGNLVNHFPALIKDFSSYLEVMVLEVQGLAISFAEGASSAAAGVATWVGAMAAAFAANWGQFVNVLKSRLAEVGGTFSAGWNAAMSTIGGVLSSVGSFLKKSWDTGWETFKTGFASGIQSIGTFFVENWQIVLTVIGLAVAGVAAVLLAPFAGVAAGAAGAATTIGTTIAAIVSGLILLLIPFWDDIKEGFNKAWGHVSNWVTKTGSSIGDWATTTGGKIKTWASDAGGKFKSLATTAKQTFTDWTGKAKVNVSSFVTSFKTSVGNLPTAMGTAASNLYTRFKTFVSKLPSYAGTIVTNMVTEFKKLPDKIMEAIKSIPEKIGNIFGKIQIPSFSDMGNAVKTTWKKITMPGYANGGIITSDHIARVGEGNKREAIIPLENSTAMAPFADAVASRMISQMPQQGGGNNQQQQPILYVGTLIADDRGLKELERRMNVVRLNESGRGVR